MRRFEYTRVETGDAALQTYAAAQAAAGAEGSGMAYGQAETAYLGGGTNLLDHLKLGVREVGAVVDVSRLPLAQIEETAGGLRVGAMVRNSHMAAHAGLRQRFPLVARALLSGASGQIRNMATTGGNLLQRTRCVYFTDPTLPCNKREAGTGCAAQEGFGRYNAILGTSEQCVAVHPSDLCVALAALDVDVLVRGVDGGERRIPFANFHRLPEDDPQRDTTLNTGDLITAIELRDLPAGTRSEYRKVRDRASYAFALVSVAATLKVEGGQVSHVRLGLGGVAHKPWRAEKAEAALLGGPATPERFRAAIRAELEGAQAGPENAYKLPLLENVVTAVLEDLSNTEPSSTEEAGA